MVNHFKLNTGEEIIATIEKNRLFHYDLYDALIINSRDDGKFLLSSYFPILSEDKITISKKHVISIIPVDKKLEEYYRLSLIIAKEFKKATINSIDSAIINMKELLNMNNNSKEQQEVTNVHLPSNNEVIYVHEGNKTIN